MNNGNSRTGRLMLKMLAGFAVAVLALSISGVASAQNQGIDDSAQMVVRFKGGIGVIPVSGVAANGTVNLNVVRGVNPGAPWRIADLEADVRSDGNIHLVGRGLLLANGNRIGTNGGASVHATVFCGAADATATTFDSVAVPLDENGDFRIDGLLAGGSVPTTCSNPALLIRVGQPGGGVWFAAGIPTTEAAKSDQ